ncbi:phosphate-starvation-inducible PsiE family protein [Ningiella sp. W23]|uniref:phosphate-starvation-inducible PsiE family protein n=1 Tax=Ningiella sp. W23 TaxID=3023715 RepID=UPI00375677AA
MDDKQGFGKDEHHLSRQGSDRLIGGLNRVIEHSIRVLAVLMVLVIILCIADVFFVLYEKLSTPPLFVLEFGDIFTVFASFLAVLIAIEIFANITLYLRDDVIHIRLVIATALMAIARKVIVLDFTTLTADYVYGIAGIILALGITYFLVASKART